MDEVVICSKCHRSVDATDYYCRNCGKKLHSPPLTADFSTLIILFLKTVLLPPLGFIWGFRYLFQPDNRSKLIGFLVIVITLIETILLTQYTITMVNTATEQINQQLNSYGL